MSLKGVGIDVSYPEEFSGSYPFARVFRPQEMDFAGVLCQGATARGAALLWSVKETSVKATGGGFNIFDPLEEQVGTPVLGGQGIFFKVIADHSISAWARPEGQGWLSVACS
jgi:phosphopantetheinyl transferase